MCIKDPQVDNVRSFIPFENQITVLTQFQMLQKKDIECRLLLFLMKQLNAFSSIFKEICLIFLEHYLLVYWVANIAMLE